MNSPTRHPIPEHQPRSPRTGRSDSALAAPIPPALRRGAYVLVLAGVSAWVIFTNLGGPRLEGDEAHYALCADQIRATGRWLTLSARPPTPYFEKPPLYMALTALTYDRVTGFEARYRFWSALFGVACVALTGLLGGVLLSPEAGLLAGLLLLTNRSFLLEHGARQGDMDAGLTLLMLVCLLCFARGGVRTAASAGDEMPGHSTRQRWVAWLGAGLAAGVACWLKPLAGVPLLALPAFHAFLHAGRGRRAGLAWPALASAAVLAAVASPWYLVQWHRFGHVFTDEVFGANLVKRATVGIDPRHMGGPLYYLWGVMASSPPFALFVPALAYAAARALPDRLIARSQRLAIFDRRAMFGRAAFVLLADADADGDVPRALRERRTMGLLALVGIGWLVLFSLSRSKFLHYAYPIFPVLAIALAAMFAALVRGLAAKVAAARGAGAARSVSSAAWVGILFLMAVVCCRFGFSLMRRPGEKYVPWEIYRTFEPAIADGRAKLIFCGVPATTAQWTPDGDILPSDMIYLSHMRGATRAGAADLERLLADRRPAVLLLSKDLDLQPAFDRLGLSRRFDDRFLYEYRAFTAAAVDTAPLMRVRTGGAGADAAEPWDRYLQLLAGPAGDRAALPTAFTGGFRVRVAPPLPEDCLLTVTVHRPPGAAAPALRPIVTVDELTFPNPYSVPFFEGQRIGVFIPHDPQAPRDSHLVRIDLLPPVGQAVPQAVTGAVTEMELTLQPRVPVEDPWRLR